MTYELALRLKEGGFPQEPRIDISGIDGEFFGGFYYIIKEGVDEVAPNFLDQRDYEQYLQSASDPISPANNPPELVKIPLLEDLIEAIRKLHPIEFYNGELFNLEGHWMHDFGYEAKLTIIVSLELPEEKEWKCWGDSPEESVANLWLELNKK